MDVQLPKLEGFMVYNTATGLFEKKGDNGWSKNGNIWRKLSHLKNHLQMKGVYTSYGTRRNVDKHKLVVTNAYDNCVVLDVSTQEEVPNFKIKDYLTEVAVRKINESVYMSTNFELEVK